jgi:AcrR family transcriptional regulator
VRHRARSADDKTLRSEALLAAAEELARERGGVRFITLAPVTDRAGLHRTGVRRYYASKEELLLELAERGWGQWRDAIEAAAGTGTDLSAEETATIVSATIASLPVFCDLLTHVPLHLEGEVDIERARRYKANAFAAHDAIVDTLARVSVLSAEQLADLLASALALTAYLWQVAHPTPTLAALYEQVPSWGHVALDFEGRLTHLLRATANGLSGP